MAAPSAVMPVWQDPFVEVIKFGMTHRNVGWLTQGDVEQTQDQHIHKNVFRIRGAIAATNYLRVPRDAAKGTHGLGLTGRYAYLQVRRVGGLPMTIHLDFVTTKKTALRFTLSSIYQLLRSAGTVLRVPLSLDARWTVVVVDLVRLLELHAFNQYARESYRHLKTLTLCASMNVRNVFVSPVLYTPTTLPSTLRLPGDFGEQYRWLVLPSESHPSLDWVSHRSGKQEDLRIAASPTPASRVRRSSTDSVVLLEPPNQDEPLMREADVEAVTTVSPRTRDANVRRDRNDILSKADEILRDAGIFDVGTDTANNQEALDAAYQSPLHSPATRSAAGMKHGLRTRIVSASTKAEWPDPILELDRIIGFSNEFPRTLLWVPDGSACIYTSASTIIVREFCGGSTGRSGATAETNQSTEAVSGSVAPSGPATASQEHFLLGHSSNIRALAVTSDGGLLASAELPVDSKQSGVRLWDLASRECLTVLKAQPKGVHALCFTASSKRRLLLCAVGRDECCRTQIFIWDCSCLQRGGTGSLSTTAVSLMARQTSDFPIDRIAFSPYEQQHQYHLVSCGRENVRYWRVNASTGHLTGCPVILNEYSRGTVFTDVGFDAVAETHPSNIHRVRPLYVASSLGTLLVLDYDAKQVLCVYQLHDASINCLSVNEGFCVTGSDDCFLRVWPLDFTDFFLEAHHEAGVSCLDVSADGMRVLVGSRNNAIGVLDVADQHYATLLRSHTHQIGAMTPAPWGSPLASLLIDDGVGTDTELVTASADGTLRVWDVKCAHQLYEFDIQHERVTSLAASPVHRGIVAAGFASGCTRIFDVHRTSDTDAGPPSSMLHEFRQHQSSILHIAFDAEAQHLLTSGEGRQLCLYDARQQDYLPLKMLLTDFDPKDGRFVLSHDSKWLAIVSGDRQCVVMLDPCSLRVAATVRPPKLAGASSGGQDEALKLVRFSKHSTEMLVLSASDRLHIFSLPTRGFVQSMPLLGQGGISALVMSANAKYMATGGEDGSLRVWHWDDRGRIGRMHQSFVGHAGKVRELAFTKDGKSIVATGESSAICIWQFHGDASPTSPHATRSSSDSKDAAFSRDLSAAATKPDFRLSLEADALKLRSSGGSVERDSVLSSKTDAPDVDVPTVTLRTASGVYGDLVLSSALGGFDPSRFSWSYATGKLLYTRSAILVVEDVASGRQAFYDDLHSDDGEAPPPSDEIVLLQLSPSSKYVATVSSTFDAVSVRSLCSEGAAIFLHMENNTTCTRDGVTLIPLLPDVRDVTALAFAQCSMETNTEDLICVACDVGRRSLQPQSVVTVASVAERCIIWSSLASSGLQSTGIRQILATSDSSFLLLSGERSSVSALKVRQSGDFGAPQVELEALIGVFPTPVQRLSLYNRQGSVDRQRYLVGVDDDRYCYFYDLQCSTFIATTQLLLLPPTTKGGRSTASKTKTSRSCRRAVEFLEWVTARGKSLLVTGSKAESVLYVHGLPMLSTKHSARVQVDWQRVARAGVSLLCQVALDGGGLLRSLSVDPARDAGLAATDDGTVVLVHFDASPTTTVLRQTALADKVPFAVSQAGLALDGAVLLSVSEGDSALRVWLPELSRDVAAFHVDSAACTCFAVNPFSTPPQSMVMAGYSDGCLRVFDLCEMRLLSRFELTASPSKSARVDGGLSRIVFVGASAALVATRDNRVLLVDVSNAVELTGDATSARPTRPSARPAKRSERPRTKPKPRAARGRDKGREAVYRELPLLPSSYVRRKRLPGLVKSQQLQVEVGAIDVMASSDADVHPFLVVVKYSGPARYKQGRCVAKVFANATMSAEEVTPTDEWRLAMPAELSHAVATFTNASSPESVHVLHSCRIQQADESWGLELRDCLHQRALERFTCNTPPVGDPVLLRCIHAALPDAEAAELFFLADARGRSAALDLARHFLVPIHARTAQRLHLHPCGTSDKLILLRSRHQLCVASLSFSTE